MQKLLLSLTLITLLGWSVPGQVQSPQTSPNVLSELRSADVHDRAAAIEVLSSMSAEAVPEGISRALADLLVQETQLLESVLRKSNGTVGLSGQYGESYSEYYSEVLGSLERLGDKRDQRVLEALAKASYNADSSFAVKVATDYGENILPMVIDLSQSDLRYRRMQAIEMLGTIVSNCTALLPSSANRIRTAVLEALSDQANGIRLVAVQVLSRVGTEADIPLLEKIAKTDPDISKMPDGKNRYFIREAALEAITKIRQQSAK